MKLRTRFLPAAALLLLAVMAVGVAVSQESAPSAGLDVNTLSEFNRLDRDGDGGLDRMEFGFTEIGQRAQSRGSGADAKIDRIFGKIDRDNDGKIGLFELAQSQHNRNVRIMDRETSGKFAEFDGDDDGFISREEFAASPSARKAIESGKDADYVKGIFDSLDLNQSGVIGPFEYAQLKAGNNLPEPEKEAARKFVRADRNDDGVIDRDEFLETPLGRHTTSEGSPGDIDEIFGAIDVNGNGEIGAQEFGRARENQAKVGVPKVILESYDDLDRNGDGLISLREFGRDDVAKRAPNRNAVAAMFARADVNRDEGLGLGEYYDLRVRIRQGRAMDRPGAGGKGAVPKGKAGGGR